MSAGRGSGGAAGGGGVQPIPAGSRAVVQSLKEIVNCPDAEIYATLKDCNMDPNEAINRLLSQDTFHEVKSKREKKKEGKDSSETRSRGANNNSNRTSKSAADRHLSRGASAAQYNASESTLHGKSTNKKENGSSSYRSSSSSAPGISGNTRSREHSGLSVGASAESKGSWLQTADVMPPVAQPVSGHSSAWSGVAGQVSMADIVRMGRPNNKAPNPSTTANVHQWEASTNEDWPSIEKPPVTNVTSAPEYSVDSELHTEASGVVTSDSINHHSEAEQVGKIDDNIEISGGNDRGFVSVPSRKIPDDVSRVASVYDDELYKNPMASYQPEAHGFEYHEKAHEFEHNERDHDFEHHEDEEVGASVSSVTRNLQQLSVTKDNNRGFSSVGNPLSVVIPDHLQVQSAECSHLSFGSFGSGMSIAKSSTSMLVKNNMEETHRVADIPSAEHLDTRRSEYYVDDVRTNAPDVSLFGRNGASGENYDASSASQQEELLKPESADVAHGNQYAFPSSNNAGYIFDDSQHLNAAFNQRIPQMQNLAQFSNVLHSHTNSLPSTLLTANVHPTRESDLHYSPFSATQSMSAKYGNSVSSMGVSSLPIPEALKTVGLSSSQPAQQAISGHPLPQQVALNPYPQPNLPMGQFPNMIGYPFLPQSYTYMPSAFQQSLAGSSAYHQSLAALLPQYKSSVSSISSLPQSASGYGGFGNNSTIPGNYPMNPQSAAPMSESALSYDDLNAQYKERSHLLSLQQPQNENSAMWLHGANSRTMPAVQGSTFYNLQGQQTQTHQHGGFRQNQPQQQQQLQNYGNPNFYSLDQLQNPRDGSVGGSQGQPKPSQIWPNNY